MLTASALWLVAPDDGSGVLSPSVTLRLGDRLAIQAALYAAHGDRPEGGALRSAFGGTPTTGFVQVGVYE